MTKALLNRVWQLRLVSLTIGSTITSLSFANALSEYVLAQIQSDSTLGGESSVVNSVDANSDRIDGGAIRDTNLFHSFQEFNVGEGKAANFANPQGIENIFSRVTGNNPSQIQGVLGVLGDANLFLLNPNGIIFGENASLNVNGSFVATTAESILFENGQEFSAINPQKPILEIKVPLGLQIGNSPGAIVNRAILLEVQAGKNLAFVGGDISLDNGIIFAPGGRVELGGLTAAGIVGVSNDGSFSFPEAVARGDVFLNAEAYVDVAGDRGGTITINTKDLKMSGDSLLVGGTPSNGISGGQSGDIILNATGAIEIDSSTVDNSAYIGNAGNIEITTNSLTLTNGATISSNTFGIGNAGNITINANEVRLLDDQTKIQSNVEAGAIGNGGQIKIDTGTLNLKRAQIQTLVREAEDNLVAGAGNAGNIIVNARDAVTIEDRSSDGQFGSGLTSELETGAKGKAGKLIRIQIA